MTILRSHFTFFILCATLATLSCSESQTNSPTTTDTSSRQPSSIWPKLNSPLPYDAELEQRITDIVAQMQLRDKIGQMIQAEIRSVTPEEVKQYRLGSVLNGGGTRPNNDKYATPQDWINLADAYYQALHSFLAVLQSAWPLQLFTP
jgi:beta-glucosidase